MPFDSLSVITPFGAGISESCGFDCGRDHCCGSGVLWGHPVLPSRGTQAYYGF